MSNSIPVMRKPADAMSKGLNSSNLAAAAVQRHPIDRMQRATASNGATESPLDLDAIRRLYGSGLAMRLATERQMALKVGGRLPGLDAHPDSRAMYETLTGDDVSIGFGDFLNLRRNRPEGEILVELRLMFHTLLWSTSLVFSAIVTEHEFMGQLKVYHGAISQKRTFQRGEMKQFVFFGVI